MNHVIEFQQRGDTPPPEHRTPTNARIYLRGLHRAHMEECDIADECGGSYMRGPDFPLEVPLWVVEALAKEAADG